MNSAAIALRNRPANTCTTVEKTGKTVTYRNVSHSHHVAVTPKTKVVVWGSSQRYVAGRPGVVAFVPYRAEFKIGDVAVCGGFNLTYTGVVVAIGEKTITVEEYSGTRNAKKHRLSIERFCSLNSHFDLAAIAKSNSEWMD